MLQKDNLRFQVVDSTCRRLVVAVLMGLLYEGSKRWQRKKDGNEEVTRCAGLGGMVDMEV